MNLEGFTPQEIDITKLPIEDKWLLSRLSTVTQQVSDGIDHYQYSDVAQVLFDFAWNEFCSFYVEIAKPRLSDPEQKVVTQNVIAHGLDQLLRLLHPIMPFVTESVWSYLGELAPKRGVPQPADAGPFVMTSEWPTAHAEHHDVQIERQFSEFQQIVAAIRQIRASQNIKPSDTVPVAIRCDESSRELLAPMKAYFLGLASADVVAIGADAQAFETDAHLGLPEANVDVHVDLEQFIDVDAELGRLEKLLGQITGQITGKENKLNNESFVSRAPVEIVTKERESLVVLREQYASVSDDISRLQAKKK
jgi:valyl-tRNA synthetase